MLHRLLNESSSCVLIRMLDDFAHEMETTETKMDSVMKKMAKVLHMSNGICIFLST